MPAAGFKAALDSTFLTLAETAVALFLLLKLS